MLVDLTGIRNIREQDEVDIGTMWQYKHTLMMEQKAQNRSQRPLTAVLRTSKNNTRTTGIENITGNINDNVIEKVVEEQMMENLSGHNNLD